MSENDFLRAVLATPNDDALLKVYSDWLEDQGDPASASKAEFLRVTVTPAAGKGGTASRDRQLQRLAADLETDWLAVVSRMQIENCARQKSNRSSPIAFEFLCRRRWEELLATDEDSVRFCDDCKENVHYCDTILEARGHASKGHCIAVDLGVIRRKGDLAPSDPLLGALLGRPSPESIRKEMELAKPDPVSAERERRKKQKRRQATNE